MLPSDALDARLDAGVHPVLQTLPILDFTPPDVRRLVEYSFTPATYPFGAVIVREGDPSDAMYVVVSGRARAVKRTDNGQEIQLNVLGPGDLFGEVGLLSGAARMATVRASSEVEVLRLDGSVFRGLVKAHPSLREALELQSRHRLLRTFLLTYPAFSKLPEAAMRSLLAELEPISAGSGDQVIREGDSPGPLYLVEEGRLRVYRAEDRGRGNIRYLRRGDVFGESSVFTGQPRVATVEAVTDCSLLVMQPATFDRLLSENETFRAAIERRVDESRGRRLLPVPLDFAREILPADPGPGRPVGLEQVERVLEADDESQDLGVGQAEDREGYGRRRRQRRFPHVHQVDEMDCGAACLAIVCRAFGRAVSMSHLRAMVHASVDGTSLLGLVQGAEQVGLAARAVKVSKSRLDEMSLPAIVHVEGNHWVVLFQVRPGFVRVSDPARGLRKLRRAEFEGRWSGYAALLAPTPALQEAPEAGSGFTWVWPFFRPHLSTLVWSAGLALVVAGLSMLIPVFTKVIVDRVVVARQAGVLGIAVLAMAVVLVLMTAVTLVQRYLLSRTAVRIDGAALDSITAKMLALPMSYFYSRRTGDISRRLAGMRQAREFLVQSGVAALSAVAQLVAAIALMLLYSRLLTLVFLAVAPAYALLMRFSSTRLQPMFDTLEEAFGKYHSSQIDAIKGIETVKAMGAEEGLRARMAGQFAGLTDRLFRADLTIMFYEGVIQMVTFASLILFLWVGARQVLAGRLTIGGLVAFDSLVVLANGPILTLLSLWDQLQYSSVLLNRLNDVFDQEREQGDDHSNLHHVPTLQGSVRFRNVGFRYPGPSSTPILEGIDLEVPAGTTVAVVGRSGSGKTTLMKCLAGLIEPTEGTIQYDGIDLRSLEYRELRRHIGFVLQENYLFDDTIARNVALGEDVPDMDRVIWAAKVANAHDFIDRLPLGYDTRVGETGILLSGGQKQRIAIARAVYGRPPVIVFDEATSALDSESERAVQNGMEQLLEGRTSFVIAHRLSTIRDADLIVVLERGRLAERGTHDELLERQGLYSYLVSQQQGI